MLRLHQSGLCWPSLKNTLWSAYIGGAGKNGLRDLVYPSRCRRSALEMVRHFYSSCKLPLWRCANAVCVRPHFCHRHRGADGWTDVWMERLGFSPSEVSALSASDQWWRLYGYDSQSDALQPDACRNGKTLARRLDVTYQELRRHRATRFLNPHIEDLMFSKTSHRDPMPWIATSAKARQLTAAEKSEVGSRFARARRAAVRASTPSHRRSARPKRCSALAAAGCDFSTTSLAFDQNPADEPQALHSSC